MKVSSNYIVREIMGEFILIPVDSEDNLASLVTINECGKDIFEMLPDAENDKDIIDKMKEIYDVADDVLEKDVEEFLTKLRELKILLD